MAECDGAAVDIDLVAVKMKLAIAGKDLSGEGFVKLDEIKVFQGEAVFLLHLAERGHGADAHDAGIDADRGKGEDAGERLEIVLLDEFFAGENDGGGAVSDAGRIAGGDCPSFGKNRC